MQKATKQEIREVKAMVRKALTDRPETRGNDDALYYWVCKERAKEIGVDMGHLHFAVVFLGNPLHFPRYESVVRMRRMIQRQEPELQAETRTRANRSKKEADMVECARNGGKA